MHQPRAGASAKNLHSLAAKDKHISALLEAKTALAELLRAQQVKYLELERDLQRFKQQFETENTDFNIQKANLTSECETLKEELLDQKEKLRTAKSDLDCMKERDDESYQRIKTLEEEMKRKTENYEVAFNQEKLAQSKLHEQLAKDIGNAYVEKQQELLSLICSHSIQYVRRLVWRTMRLSKSYLPV